MAMYPYPSDEDFWVTGDGKEVKPYSPFPTKEQVFAASENASKWQEVLAWNAALKKNQAKLLMEKENLKTSIHLLEELLPLEDLGGAAQAKWPPTGKWMPKLVNGRLVADGTVVER